MDFNRFVNNFYIFLKKISVIILEMIFKGDSSVNNKISFKTGTGAKIIFTSSGPIVPAVDPYLSVFNDDGSLFNFYDGETEVIVSSMAEYNCDPVGLSGGSSVTNLLFYSCAPNTPFSILDTSDLTALTSLEFTTCGFLSNFSLLDTSGLTSLQNLLFSNCGYGGFVSTGVFSLPDTSGLTALTNLSFTACGFSDFSLPDTSGLTALTNLSFNSCGYSIFSLPDTSGLTSLINLSINNCGYYGNFSLDTSGLTALTSLYFENCGLSNLSIFSPLPDTSSLTSLTNLSFINCGSNSFEFSDTSGLIALTSLSFNQCSLNGSFSISDTSGLTSLTSLSFSYCGYFGTFSLPNTAIKVGTLSSLTSLLIQNCGATIQEAEILLILEALDTAGNSNGTVTINRISGTDTLATVIASLEGKGWTISIT
jgi:hypothetical protein